MFTEKISQEKVDEIRLALETSMGYKSSLTNLELKAIIYFGNKIASKVRGNRMSLVSVKKASQIVNKNELCKEAKQWQELQQ